MLIMSYLLAAQHFGQHSLFWLCLRITLFKLTLKVTGHSLTGQNECFCACLNENEKGSFCRTFDGSSFSLSEAKPQSDNWTCLKLPDQRAAGDLNMLFWCQPSAADTIAIKYCCYLCTCDLLLNLLSQWNRHGMKRLCLSLKWLITLLLTHTQGSQGFQGFPGANGEKGTRVCM